MFRSADSVLKWAYFINSTLLVKMSAINTMYGKSRPASDNEILRGLTPQECKQQAADIARLAYDLSDPACTEYIEAMYGRKFDEQHIGRLIERVLMMLGTGTFNRRAIRKLILCYFGDKSIKRDEIRDEMKCGNDRVTAIRKRVYDALDKIGCRATSEMEDKLKGRGILEFNSVCR